MIEDMRYFSYFLEVFGKERRGHKLKSHRASHGGNLVQRDVVSGLGLRSAHRAMVCSEHRGVSARLPDSGIPNHSRCTTKTTCLTSYVLTARYIVSFLDSSLRSLSAPLVSVAFTNSPCVQGCAGCRRTYPADYKEEDF